tara:strand:- start:12 stop:437 length:426 start_codon:yes stop_codon:yes gene_type:complete
MAYQQGSVHAYRQTRVKTASQGRIIVMLYDEAIRQIDDATALLETGTKQLDKVNNGIVKAQDIVTELMVALDMEQGGEIAHNLFRLYMYFNDRLMEGNVQKDVAPLKEIRGLMASLRDAWKQIENTAAGAQAPVSGVNIAG